MIDIAAMQKDPEFEALTPKQQQAQVDAAQRMNYEEQQQPKPQPTPFGQGAPPASPASPFGQATPGPAPEPGAVAPGRDVSGFPAALGRVMFGDTPTSQATTGAVVGMDALRMAGALGGPWGRFASMVVPTAVSAFTGAITTPESPSAGAAAGALEGGLTVLPGGLFAGRVQSHYAEHAERTGLAHILQRNFPSLGGTVTPAIERLEALLRGPAGERLAGCNLQNVKAEVSAAMANKMVPVPSLAEAGISPPMAGFNAYTFDDADKAITQLHHRGYVPVAGDPRTTPAAPEIRNWAHGAREELINEIAKVDPDLAAKYQDALAQFSNMRTIRQRLFTQKGVINNGRINMFKVREIIQTDPDLRDALEREGSDFGQELINWAHEGAPPTDIGQPGRLSPGLSFHFGYPRAWAHPQLPRGVGNANQFPFPVRTFMLGPTRAVGEGITGGPAEAADEPKLTNFGQQQLRRQALAETSRAEIRNPDAIRRELADQWVSAGQQGDAQLMQDIHAEATRLGVPLTDREKRLARIRAKLNAQPEVTPPTPWWQAGQGTP